jgi:hypothetical protein
MAKIPGIQRQRLMPFTTGATMLQVVPQSTAVEDAIGNAANLALSISGKMFEADSNAQLSTANVNTQMELSALEVELARGDSETAMVDYATRSQAIYAKNAEGMSPLVLAEYDANFATLSAKTNLSLTGTIATRRSSDRVAGGLVSLDALIKMYAPPTNDPNKSPARARLDREAALIQGEAIVRQLVASNDKTPEQGAKMLLDFFAKFNDERFVGWVNALPQKDVGKAFTQMSAGDFGDEQTNQAWSQLPEKRKRALIDQSLANASKLLTFQDAEDRRILGTRQAEAKKLMIEFATEKDPTRRQEILTELANNPGMTPTLYNKMVQDNAGATNRFDDLKAIRDMDKRIMRFGAGAIENDVTIDEIMGLSFSDGVLSRMMTDLREVQDVRMQDAMDLILSSPLFAPSSSSEKRRQGDAMDRRQLKIKNQLISERIDHRDRGEAFDPVDRARQLLGLLRNDRPELTPEARQQAAQARLRDQYKINNANDYNIYMSGSGNSGADKQTVNRLYLKAFPKVVE